jgi:hypothetical protein
MRVALLLALTMCIIGLAPAFSTSARAGSFKHRDFYIVNGGAELKWINTDPPGTVLLSASGTMTKQ